MHVELGAGGGGPRVLAFAGAKWARCILELVPSDGCVERPLLSRCRPGQSLQASVFFGELACWVVGEMIHVWVSVSICKHFLSWVLINQSFLNFYRYVTHLRALLNCRL